MASLSYAELEGVWLNAAQGTKYATKPWAALMAAIAMAESGGNPDATNPDDNNGTQTSWGLWQISLGNHNEPASNWNDPTENARLAIGKLNDQGLSAWGTYDSGAYQKWYNGNIPPNSGGNSGGNQTTTTSKNSGDGGIDWWSAIWTGVEGGLFQDPNLGAVLGGPNPLSALTAIAKDIQVFADDFAQLLKWSSWLFAPSNWLRIGAFFFGLACFGAGIYMFKEAL